MERRTIALIIAVILIAGAIAYLQQFSPDKSYAGTSVAPGNRTAVNAEKAPKYERAKEIALPSGFVNIDNITIRGLIGKDVILVDFWTYSCINCERTIPYLNMWYAKYHDKGLEIIGVHTPEFPFEHDITNVRRAVAKSGIRYPVVLDNDYATWGSYGNQYWPADYLIDIDGFVVDKHFGEGDYDATEKKIQALLQERADALGITIPVPNTTGIPQDEIPVDFTKVGSPETYFGSGWNEYLANGRQLTAGPQILVRPITEQPNALYLSGSWNFQVPFAENTGTAAIMYRYNAKNVYFVASAANATAVHVLLDGNPVTSEAAGADVRNSTVLVKDQQLYSIISGSDYGEHLLELDIMDPGLQAYTFTFG
jgi:thiol-disulfide isomerase/thioredoxin